MDVDVVDRGDADDFDGRVYELSDGREYPSVTTIISHYRDKYSEDDFSWWKNQMDGKNGRPYHEDIFHYSGYRGTLIHYALLNPLTDEELWGYEEEQARADIDDFGDYKYHEDEDYIDASDRLQRDVAWARDKWRRIKKSRGISKDNIIDVERYVAHEDYGYAGQFDLLYRDDAGSVVLADIKTSKWVKDKHRTQLAAYSQTLDVEPDRLEVMKLHPEEEWVSSDGYRPVEIETSYDWGDDGEVVWDDYRRQVWEFYSDHDDVLEMPPGLQDE